jgi:hypothetical protein
VVFLAEGANRFVFAEAGYADDRPSANNLVGAGLLAKPWQTLNWLTKPTLPVRSSRCTLLLTRVGASAGIVG